jgi:D-aminopeptidase
MTDMPRARDLGLAFAGTPGPCNAITDVPGVAVGMATLARPEAGVLTGVTAIFPRGAGGVTQPVAAGLAVFNGTGELTGAHMIAERGVLEGPIMLTGTHNLGVVYDAALRWLVAAYGNDPSRWFIPTVAETWDGHLHDANGSHLRAEHVMEALAAASTGAVPEGNVGGGTGMRCYGFKGGTGTASRQLGDGMLGVLVQANFGAPGELRVLGHRPAPPPAAPPASGRDGSIIGIIATDLKLGPSDLQRLARRAILGMARTGTAGHEGSGDIFLAISTAPADAPRPLATTPAGWKALDPVFAAATDATEEAILNALVGARSVVGRNGHAAVAIDHAALRAIVT